MTQIEEAIARYHRILESEPYRDLRWVKNLQEQMEARRLSAGGRLLCPFLRPNFVTQRQYDAMVKNGEALISAVDRMMQMALASPQLLSTMQLLPAEKMLAAIDPGYAMPEVSAQIGLQINNGSMHVQRYSPDSIAGGAYAEGLSDVFYDCAPVKEFRRRYHLTRVGAKKPFLQALLKAWKLFSGNSPKKPNIAILEIHAGTGSEYEIFRDYFRSEGYQAEMVSPDQLDYRGGVLRGNGMDIDLLYRRVSAQEFLMKFTLDHPLVHAYRDRRVCVVNSFRSEITHKKAMFALLTDESLTAKFPAAEKKAIQENIPYTRVVKAGKSTWRRRHIDMIEFLRARRKQLVLRPNDDYADLPSFVGAEHDEVSWERAIREAQRAPYVVQENVKPVRTVFPMMTFGNLEFKEMQVDVQPQAYLGKVASCPSYVSSPGIGYSQASGITPTFIIESKN